MRRTELLHEVRKMRFEEAYEGWDKGRLGVAYGSASAEAAVDLLRSIGRQCTGYLSSSRAHNTYDPE